MMKCAADTLISGNVISGIVSFNIVSCKCVPDLQMNFKKKECFLIPTLILVI